MGRTVISSTPSRVVPRQTITRLGKDVAAR